MSVLILWQTEDGSIRIYEDVAPGRYSVSISFDGGATEEKAILGLQRPDRRIELMAGGKKHFLHWAEEGGLLRRFFDDFPLIKHENGRRW